MTPVSNVFDLISPRSAPRSEVWAGLRCPTRLTCMDPMRTHDDRLPQPMPDPTPTWGRPLAAAPTWTQVPAAAGRADERIGDAERSRTCDELSAHYAAGRLSPVELDSRLAAAVEALTMRDLHAVTRDLPRLGGPAPARPVPLPPRAGWTAVDLLILLVLLGSALMAGGLLLVLGAYEFGLFIAAGFGGTAAFVAGAATVHLVHRRSAPRESAQREAAQRPRIA